MAFIHRLSLAGVLGLGVWALFSPVRAGDATKPSGAATQVSADTTQPAGITLKSADEQVQVVVPEGWVKTDSTNGRAAVEAHNEDFNGFVMVAIDDRSDPYASLEDYAKDRCDEVMGHLIKKKASEAKEIQIDGHDAVQYEIHGIIPETKSSLGYVLTLVEHRRHYVQILTWSTESHFDRNVKALRTITETATYAGEQ